MEDETPFLFRSPFLPERGAEAVERNAACIERDLASIRTRGYDEFARGRVAEAGSDAGGGRGRDAAAEELGTAFDGSLRDYQTYMLERAREENVVVHLGTGMGKTLVGIFLIREFLARRRGTDEDKNHILFLVPSVALAVQHTDTLRANLPCVVAAACHTSSHSAKAREEIADADVIVATHGTALDLLRHYPDVLSMEKVELLVMDECHYATRKHNYATILRDYYDPLLPEARPRVLGLTASPLINLRINNTESQLRTLLSKFEKTMDSRLYGVPSGVLPRGRGGKEAEESVVAYDSRSESFDADLPPARRGSLHGSREKEIKQLGELCREVGLRVTAAYASTLAREIGRNEFDRETPAQFENLKRYLDGVASRLNQRIAGGGGGIHGGHTDKMNRLEELLEDAVGPAGNSAAPVGIVFVETRIAAIALCNYFRRGRRRAAAGAPGASPRSVGAFPDGGADKMRPKGSPSPAEGSAIRPDVVVRQATQVFKYLGRRGGAGVDPRNQLGEEWVHQTRRIRTVIRKLRRRETNVLIATSVVEEGVDVEACQFIVAFNGLKTIKSYVQMKGRARQKNARFFVFVDDAPDKSQPLSLGDAQIMEDVIHDFIAENNHVRFGDRPAVSSAGGRFPSSDEEGAMRRGEYATPTSGVDLSSSKSLLNRYALSVPLEPNCRTSKEATTLHMPIYAEDRLILPSHLPPTIREVILPVAFRGEAKKKKQSLLALAACVRLHKLGLLNERLLPLSASDMKGWLLEKALIELELPSCKRQRKSFETPCMVHVYGISQSGDRFNEEEKEVRKGSSAMRLALISLSSLPRSIPSYSFKHKELGSIECRVSYRGKASLSGKEWKELTDFHCIVFNSRWRQRRNKSRWFRFDEQLPANDDQTVAQHIIGCLNTSGGIDWVFIRKTIRDFSRLLAAREAAAQGDSRTGPRIWSPLYNQNASYIVYGPSGKKCEDPFPGEAYASFQDYYAKKYGIEIGPNGKMYRAKRMWEFPQTLSATQVESSDEDIKDVPTVDLPQELFAESPLADPVIMLHSVVLPQLLYQLERYLTVTSFIGYCRYNFPILGECLSELSVESVMESLTAKSCCMDVTYDRLEWLGDAVLKLLHTDSLLKWEYTSYLHEGYLTMIRSVMGSNDRLKEIAKETGFEGFILLKSLNRAEWCPFGLRYCEVDKDCSQEPLGIDDDVKRARLSDKVRADVIEALIGLIFIEFGYEQCEKVACEIGVSLRAGNADNVCRKWSDVSQDPNLVSFACDLVGVTNFLNPHLLEEAVTHQSCLHKPVPSYQRLEWVGDAVLCLAAREWLFRREEKLFVSKLVVLETTLVCNESLAYLGFTKGLHRFIDHRNAALPGRFESYQLDLEMGRGLWSTDPPKVIPDVVEALIGAVHVDSGLHNGQRAALRVIAPLLQSLSHLLTSESKNLMGLLHPKQNLYEMTGGIVSVRVYKEEVFHRLGFSSPLWNFGSRASDGVGYVGVVRCKQILLAAAIETSKLAAINVVCELTVQILTEKPSIISMLQNILSSLAD